MSINPKGKYFVKQQQPHYCCSGSNYINMTAGSADLPRFYHDVIGVAVIIADEGSPPQEAFRYPFWNKRELASCIHCCRTRIFAFLVVLLKNVSLVVCPAFWLGRWLCEWAIASFNRSSYFAILLFAFEHGSNCTAVDLGTALVHFLRRAVDLLGAIVDLLSTWYCTIDSRLTGFSSRLAGYSSTGYGYIRRPSAYSCRPTGRPTWQQ